MPDDTNEQGRHEVSSNETEDRALSRRNILLGSSALVAAAAMTSDALAQAQKAAPAAAAARPLHPAANPISSLSGVTTSASRTSVRIPTA